MGTRRVGCDGRVSGRRLPRSVSISFQTRECLERYGKYAFTWRVRPPEPGRLSVRDLDRSARGDDSRVRAAGLREQQEAIAAKKEAQTASKLKAEYRKHLTLRALLEAYTRLLHAKGKSKSAASAQSAFRCHVFTNENISNVPSNEVTARQVATLVRKVQEAGKERTAGILRSYISAAYNAAKKAPFSATLPAEMISYDIKTNPAEAVPAIPVISGNRVLSTNELKAYIKHLGDTLPDTALRLALFAGGQRIAQLLRVTVGDFDTDTFTAANFYNSFVFQSILTDKILGKLLVKTIKSRREPLCFLVAPGVFC